MYPPVYLKTYEKAPYPDDYRIRLAPPFTIRPRLVDGWHLTTATPTHSSTIPTHPQPSRRLGATIPSCPSLSPKTAPDCPIHRPLSCPPSSYNSKLLSALPKPLRPLLSPFNRQTYHINTHTLTRKASSKSRRGASQAQSNETTHYHDRVPRRMLTSSSCRRHLTHWQHHNLPNPKMLPSLCPTASTPNMSSTHSLPQTPIARMHHSRLPR
jgi:hypothetical protein